VVLFDEREKKGKEVVECDWHCTFARGEKKRKKFCNFSAESKRKGEEMRKMVLFESSPNTSNVGVCHRGKGKGKGRGVEVFHSCFAERVQLVLI